MKKPFLLILTIHLIASALSFTLVTFRIAHVGRPHFAFLLWNLFLAWLPFLFATAAFMLRRRLLPTAVLSALWLLFLPNAPYLITDLIHLQFSSSVPIWYDMIMLLTFSLTGLLLGLTSLNLMHTIVEERFGRFVGWFVVVSTMGLTGYGIYLGRFLRWNSWDVLTNPLSLANDMLTMLRHPIAHIESYVISLAFTFIFLLAYVTIISLGYLQKAAVRK